MFLANPNLPNFRLRTWVWWDLVEIAGGELTARGFEVAASNRELQAKYLGLKRPRKYEVRDACAMWVESNSFGLVFIVFGVLGTMLSVSGLVVAIEGAGRRSSSRPPQTLS